MSLACKVDLYVTGDAGELAAFEAAFLRVSAEPEEPGLSATNFGAFLPEPDTSAPIDERSRWMTRNWGPRWDAFGIDAEDLPQGGTSFAFWTKSGEPSAVIEAASAMFPHLTFEYWYQFEDGSDQDNRTYVAGEDADA